MDQTGIVFNVQRFTIHDGPGVRTEFFLKGCPLRCQWCSNPESWALQPQVGVYRTKCIGRRACGACDDSCPQGEIFRFTAGRLAGIDRTKCSDCLVCAEECPSDALKQWGRPMKVEECMEIVRRDQLFKSALVFGIFLVCHQALPPSSAAFLAFLGFL